MSNFFTSLLVTLLLGTLFCVECTISDDERAFMSVPSPQSSYDNLKYITSEEHVAGTEGDYKVMGGEAQQQWRSTQRIN